MVEVHLSTLHLHGPEVGEVLGGSLALWHGACMHPHPRESSRRGDVTGSLGEEHAGKAGQYGQHLSLPRKQQVCKVLHVLAVALEGVTEPIGALRAFFLKAVGTLCKGSIDRLRIWQAIPVPM